MNKPVFTVGERVEKLCVVCNEVRGHVVVSITKRGQVSRVSCPKCGERSAFKSGVATDESKRSTAKAGAPYDRTRTYQDRRAVFGSDSSLDPLASCWRLAELERNLGRFSRTGATAPSLFTSFRSFVPASNHDITVSRGYVCCRGPKWR